MGLLIIIISLGFINKQAYKHTNTMPRERHLTGVIVTFSSTIAFFLLEAILHYNIGKTGHITLKHFPGFKDFVKIVSVVVLFAFLSTVVAELINHTIGT